MAQTFPDRDWDLVDASGRIASWDHVAIAVLMDIRRELKTLNGIIGCQNFIAIPNILREIRNHADRVRLNTTKRRKRSKR